MRFSEALALTPKDFDFSRQLVSVAKTWNYKGDGGFLPTKNRSSIRKIQLDWQTVIQFAGLLKNMPEDEPIFIKNRCTIPQSTTFSPDTAVKLMHLSLLYTGSDIPMRLCYYLPEYP